MNRKTPILSGIVIVLLILSCCAGCILTDTPLNETENTSSDNAENVSFVLDEQRHLNGSIDLPAERITAVLTSIRYPHIVRKSEGAIPENVTGSENKTIPGQITTSILNETTLVQNSTENTSAINDRIEIIPEGLPIPASPIVIPDVYNFSSFSPLCPINNPLNRVFSFAIKWDKINVYALDYEVNETPTILRSTVKPHTFTNIREGISDFGKKEYYEHEAEYINPNAFYGVGIIDKDTGAVILNKGMDQFVDFEKVGRILLSEPGNYQFVCYGREVDVEISFFTPDLDFEPEVTDGTNYTSLYQAGTIIQDCEGNLGVITQVNTDEDYYVFRTLMKDPNGNYYLMKDATFEEMGRKEDPFRIDHMFTEIYLNMSKSDRIGIYRPYSDMKIVLYGYLSPDTPTTMKFTPK